MKYSNSKSLANQKGAALIVLVLTFIMATSVLVISNYSIDKGKISYEKRTTESLAKAKEALIAFTATYHEKLTATGEPRDGMFGFLPCPDGGTSEGVSETASCGTQYQSYLGRLPWKTLGIEPVKDGSGNCLWYAVSSEYKNIGRIDPNPLSSGSGLVRSDMLNEDSNGSFTLFDASGNPIKGVAAEDRPVAIIIAPGGALAGQNRGYDNSTQCGGDYTASNFLDVFGGVDNSSITLSDDVIDDFITSALNNTGNFNDRIITISQAEVFDEIKKRSDFTTLMNNTTRELAECIAEFGLTNPVPGGGCDLTVCLQQCSNDQTACYNQCANCSLQCDLDYDACLAAGTKKNICNKTKADCKKACPKIKQCEKSCDSVFTSCEADCNTNCTLGGGGGNDYRLPWPTPMTLADYRDSQLYVENASGNHLGHFPVDVGTADATTTNAGGQYLIENDYTSVNVAYTHCQALNTDAMGTYNSAERRIWQNWKDHFFYAVSNDFDLNAATPTPDPCTSCLSINGAGSYAAIVLFSGSRIAAQIRTVGPDADTKQTISNYLEGNNATNYPDAAGNGDYQTGTVNDVAYCINEDMSVVLCP